MPYNCWVRSVYEFTLKVNRNNFYTHRLIDAALYDDRDPSWLNAALSSSDAQYASRRTKKFLLRRVSRIMRALHSNGFLSHRLDAAAVDEFTWNKFKSHVLMYIQSNQMGYLMLYEVLLTLEKRGFRSPAILEWAPLKLGWYEWESELPYPRWPWA